MRPTQATVDRSRFQTELARNPNLMYRAAWMVNGEVGKNAPLQAKITQLETVFNRVQMRGQSLEHGLMTHNYRGGYYAMDTYKRSAMPTQGEYEQFLRDVATPVLNGSNMSDIGYGPMTGNASGGLAARQMNRQDGYHLQGGDSYFREPNADGRLYKLPELQGQPAAPAQPPTPPRGVNPPPTPSGNPLAPPRSILEDTGNGNGTPPPQEATGGEARV
jgi:hypothetical protein